jgi:hypothetical protein
MIPERRRWTHFLLFWHPAGMTKQEQFLWIVQTTILANGINLSSNPDYATKYRADYSATAVLITADDAIYASGRVPEHMTAYQAANEFFTYILQNLRDAEEKAGNEVKLPSWFARS